MSVSASPVLRAIASQLASCLDDYGQELDGLLRKPTDEQLYAAASKRIDELRQLSASHPQLALRWVELLIRHFEFTHGLLRLQAEGCEAGELEQLHASLKGAVSALAAKSTQLTRAA